MTENDERWHDDPSDAQHEAALAEGLTVGRELLQLRIPLPLTEPTVAAAREVDTRAFAPHTEDEAAWIAVNNRAFSWHPDQSGMTIERLRAHYDEDWFSADGFLLYHQADQAREERLAGFCWTKVHAAADGGPAMGEIYVIAVDPDFVGQGLGRALTTAGLRYLSDLGLEVGMLYVEADNTAAVETYYRIGFTRHMLRRQYVGPTTEDA